MQVELRAEKMEKLRRKLEELMQPVDGVAEARGRGRSVARRCQLVEAIQQLGHLPTQSKNSSQAEKTLAVRLIRARKAGSLSSEQEAALDNLAQGAAQHLVDTIMELGYLPTQSKNSTVEEKQLAVRLIKACNSGYLSSEQEGALGNLAQDQAEATAGSGVH